MKDRGAFGFDSSKAWRRKVIARGQRARRSMLDGITDQWDR